MRHFSYSRADNVDTALAAHAGQPSAYVAGGTTLLDLVKLDVMRPEHIVDINALDLHDVSALDDGRLQIGALVSNTALAHHPAVTARYPVLSEALLAGASTQLRNMASTAGHLMQRARCSYFRNGVSACNKREPGSGCAAIGGHNRSLHAVLGTSEHCIAAHPSDMCVAMAAIGAEVQVCGQDGAHSIDFLGFHLLPGTTPHLEHALAGDELITHVTLDAPIADSHSSYVKLRDRASYPFALASCAAIVALDGDTIRAARLALGGVATKPWRAHDAEAALVGQAATATQFQQAARIALQDAIPQTQNAFKIPLGRQAIVRALEQAVAQATGGSA